MSRIQQEVAKRGVGFEPTVYGGERMEERGFESIEALINTAQAKAEVRTQWSARFQVFPFNRLAWLQRVLLKALAYLFKDQRHVNFAMLQALRGVLRINLELGQRVTQLENQARILESRIETLEFRL